MNRCFQRQPRAGWGVLATLLPVVALLATAMSPTRAADYPSFSRDETITEYDVDPSWPRRPSIVAPFGWVSGMAIDREGQIWLFNKGVDPVQVYRPDGTFVRTWGKGRFTDPHQLRIDPEGYVWVADFGKHMVQKFTPEGELVLTLGEPGKSGEDETHFFRPTDMAITKRGDIYVTDGYGNRRVVQFDRKGRFVRAWGVYGSRPGEFVLPHAIVADSKDRLYVADRNSGRIHVFDRNGKVLDVWSNLLMPWGLFVTGNDDLWTCGSTPHWWVRDGKAPEFKDQILMRLSRDGRVRQVWGVPLGERGKTRPGEFSGVHCLVEDQAGNLYVGDIYGEKAQKLVPVRVRPKGDG